MHEKGNSSAWEEIYDFSALWPLSTKMLLKIVSMAAKVLPDLTPKFHDGWLYLRVSFSVLYYYVLTTSYPYHSFVHCLFYKLESFLSLGAFALSISFKMKWFFSDSLHSLLFIFFWVSLSVSTPQKSFLHLSTWSSLSACYFEWLYCFCLGIPGNSVVKNLPANSGDTGSILGWGRSPGAGNINSLQYSCLGNSMDRGAWLTTVCWVSKELDMIQQLRRRQWQPTPVLLLGQSQERRSLVGCSPWGR